MRSNLNSLARYLDDLLLLIGQYEALEGGLLPAIPPPQHSWPK